MAKQGKRKINNILWFLPISPAFPFSLLITLCFLTGCAVTLTDTRARPPQEEKSSTDEKTLPEEETEMVWMDMDHVREVVEYYLNRDYAKAIAFWNKILANYPSNQTISELIEKTKKQMTRPKPRKKVSEARPPPKKRAKAKPRAKKKPVVTKKPPRKKTEPKIEKKPVIPGKYKVVSGDNLPSVAARVYGDAGRWKMIYWANQQKLIKGMLIPGEILLIP